MENILIEQAFKIEKLFTSPMEKPSHYVMVDYANSYSHAVYPQHYPYYFNYSYNYAPQQQLLYPLGYQQAEQVSELNQLKRSLGCLNLVHTRKNDKDRYQ